MRRVFTLLIAMVVVATIGTTVYSYDACSGIMYTNYSLDYSTGSLDAMAPDATELLNSGVPGWNAKWSNDGSMIVFVGEDPVTLKAEIFTMNADGSDVTQLTHLTYTYGQNSPRFRNESKIWFTWHGPGTGNSELYEMNLDGSGLRQLSNFVPTGKQFTEFDFYDNMLVYRTQNRSWSPTGDIFVADILTDGGGNEYVDWNSALRLTNNNNSDGSLDISPDGSMIVFRRSEGGNGYSPPNNLYTMNIDGTGETKITFSTGTDDQYQAPQWSPDGSVIVCSHYLNNQQDLFIMNPDGSNPVNITNTPNIKESCCDWINLPCQGEPFADVTGTVSGPDGGMLGVQIDLKDAFDAVVATTYTDETGAYVFTEVPNGDYAVELQIPLGFTPAGDPEVAVMVDGTDLVVDFVLDNVELAKFRNVWWWKVYLEDLRENGPRGDYFTVDDVNGWCADVFEHFYNRTDGHSVAIENVTFVGDPAVPATFDDVCYLMFDAPEPSDRQAKYEQRYERYLLAHLLNFVSNRLAQSEIVSVDGATASQATTYLTDIYDNGNYDDLMTAYYNIRRIHLEQLIPAGVIPALTPDVMYKWDDGNGLLPSEFALAQNYPNPFNPSTVIEFALPRASDMTLEVYNVAGQKIATISEEHLEAGRHTLEWNAVEFASGVYLYRLQADEFVDTKKMILIK